MKTEAYLNRITDSNKSLLENMYDYAETNFGRVPDHIFNQMCDELGLDPDNELATVFESVDTEWSRTASGFWVWIKD